MPPPSLSWNTVPVFGTWRNLDGTPKTGNVRFTLAQRVVSATDEVIFPGGGSLVYALGASTGSVAAEFPASDDPDVSPNGWTVKVEEQFSDNSGSTYYIQPTLASLPIGMNLRTVTPPTTISDQPASLIRGTPGGVAALDADGDVVDAFGAKITGGAGGVVIADGSVTNAHIAAGAAIVLSKTVDSATGGGRLALTTTERTKLSGVATGATANATDAALRDRASHTGTQMASTISDFSEAAQDAAGGAIVGGTHTGITATYNDAVGTITLAAAGSADATTTTNGVIRLAGDIAGTAVAPTVPGLAGKANLTLTRRLITTATYTLVAGDVALMVLHQSGATALTITLPADSVATIPQETPIPWRQAGTGQITFVAGAGATLSSRGSAMKSAGQFAEGVVTKWGANVWVLSGDITT